MKKGFMFFFLKAENASTWRYFIQPTSSCWRWWYWKVNVRHVSFALKYFKLYISGCSKVERSVISPSLPKYFGWTVEGLRSIWSRLSNWSQHERSRLCQWMHIFSCVSGMGINDTFGSRKGHIAYPAPPKRSYSLLDASTFCIRRAWRKFPWMLPQ